MEVLAFLTWPAAIIAVFAGIIVLSYAARVHMRTRRRREERQAAERRGAAIVRKLRKCPFFNKEHDRRLAAKFAKELDEFLAKEGFTLEQLGTDRGEIDRIVKQSMSEGAEETNKLRGMIAEHRERKDRERVPTPMPTPQRAGRTVIVPELEIIEVAAAITSPVTDEQLDPYGHTFSEADLTPDDEGIVIDMSEVLAARVADDVPASFHATRDTAAGEAPEEFDLSDFEDTHPQPAVCSDPIKALQSAGNDELDSYVDERIAAIQIKDEQE